MENMIINNKTLWVRNCPKCNSIITYKRKFVLKRATLKQTICKKCTKKKEPLSSELRRNCPSCEKELIYCNKYLVKKHNILNSLCGTCAAVKRKLGKNNTHRRLEFGEAAFNDLYTHYKHSAAMRGKNFEISKDESKLLFKGNCFYCGKEPSQIKKIKNGFGNFLYNGIDRLNNDIGYIKKNCVSCCKKCNRAKDSHSLINFIKWIRQVNENTKNIIL